MGLLTGCVQAYKNSKIKKADVDSADSQKDLSGSFDEHLLDLNDLSIRFAQSHIDLHDAKRTLGLSTHAAAQKLKEDGRNALEPPKMISNWELFSRQFKNLLWILMLGAAALCFLTFIYDPSDKLNLWVGVFIVCMVFFMCIVSFLEEKKGIEVVRAFSSLMPTSCNVIRSGKEFVINPEELVVGDLVIIRSGSRVPADLRLISGTTIFDSYNVAFNGSFCVDGEGFGIVIRTGVNTVIGQIASLTTGQQEGKCKFEVEIERFVRFITVMAIAMAAVIFTIGLIIAKGRDVVRLFVTGFLMVIIANVPQGLPTTVTTELTIIARRMAKKNVFLKKLEKIDSVGATTVIASDKTGTLTKNCMTVTDMWFNNSYMSARPETLGRTTRRRRIDQEHAIDWFDAPMSDILNVICVCNKARVDETIRDKKPFPRADSEFDLTVNKVRPSKELNILGSPSEVALLRYAATLLPVQEIRETFETVFEVPFNSLRKFHLVIVTQKRTAQMERIDNNISTINKETTQHQEYILMVKGAPEVIIQKCSQMATDFGSVELFEKEVKEFQEAYDNFGDEGCRVIGFAMKKFRAPADFKFSFNKLNNVPMEEWTFLGMSAIMDPPRESTAGAVAACKQAGIKVYMVTGDHKSTATAIARQIGLIGTIDREFHEGKFAGVSQHDPSNWAVITGPELPAMTIKEWDELLEHRYIVFARTTPEHKLLIVTECQKRGEIVTVTGDGVNDAPALKKADVGVAMGLAGSDVAKQAADIVLLDDNFASIVAGIEEGRLLFDNLRKTIAYTMTHMWPELVPVMLNFFFGFPIGLTPVQLLSIDLITDIPPAVSLAYEGPEEDIMKQPPRHKNTHLVTKPLLIYTYLCMSTMISIGAVIAYLYTYWYNGIAPQELLFTAHQHFKRGALNFTTAAGPVLDEEQQVYIAAQAAASFHITITISQAFHLCMCLTRRVSIFKHGIDNIVAVFALIIDVLLIFLFTMTPGIKFIFGSEPPPWKAWLVPVGVGITMWIFNEVRKWGIRNTPRNPLVRLVKW